jgi:hypothetical protein
MLSFMRMTNDQELVGAAPVQRLRRQTLGGAVGRGQGPIFRAMPRLRPDPAWIGTRLRRGQPSSQARMGAPARPAFQIAQFAAGSLARDSGSTGFGSARQVPVHSMRKWLPGRASLASGCPGVPAMRWVCAPRRLRSKTALGQEAWGRELGGVMAYLHLGAQQRMELGGGDAG